HPGEDRTEAAHRHRRPHYSFSRWELARLWGPYSKSGKIPPVGGKGEWRGGRRAGHRQVPRQFSSGWPTLSPDSKIIACTTNNFTSDRPYRGVVGISVTDGAEKPIGSKHWYGATRRLAWLTDGSGILVIGAEYSRGLNQIWRLSYPGNEAQ